MATTTEIATSIQNVAGRLRQQFSSVGWSLEQPISQFIGGQSTTLSASSVAGYMDIVSGRVSRLTKLQLDIDGFGDWLAKISPQIDSIQFNMIHQGQVHQIANAMSVIQMIDGAIPTPPPREPKVNWEDIKNEKSLLPRDLKARLRAVSSRLDDLEPRSNEIAAKIADIENAHAAAEQLPTDLAELSEKKQELANLFTDADSFTRAIQQSSDLANELRISLESSVGAAGERIAESDEKIDNLIKKSEQALRGATSVGLSKSFSARKDALSRSGVAWTAGLVIALLTAVLIGWDRVSALREVLNANSSPTVILVNAALSVFGVGAPIWFAWLSTKQIGTTFRLAEDYAFKASVAQAYEGYRTEALTIDEGLKNRLFASALDRFEEAPIRLIDPTYHSSPLQEVMGNPALRKALEAIPGVADKIVALIPSKSAVATTILAPAVAAAATIEAVSKSHDSEKKND